MNPTPHEYAQFDRQVVRSRRSPEERFLAFQEIDCILDHFNDAKAIEEAKIVSSLESAAVWDPGTRRFVKEMPRTGMHQPIDPGNNIASEFYD